MKNTTVPTRSFTSRITPLRAVFPSTSTSFAVSVLISLCGRQATAAPYPCLEAVTSTNALASGSNSFVATRAIGTNKRDKARIKELLAEIRNQGRAPTAAPFQALAAIGNEASFEALVKSLGLIQTEAGYGMLFTSVRRYAGIAGTKKDALRFVTKHARSNQPAIAAAAVPALGAFGAEGTAALHDIAKSGRSPVGRAYALGGIREDIVAGPSSAMLDIVLSGISVPESGTRESLEKLLRAFDSPESFETMADYVRSPKSDGTRAGLVLGAVAGHRGGINAAVSEGVSAVLKSAMESKSTDLQFRALGFAASRGTAIDVDLLKRLVKSKDVTVRRAAYVAGVRVSDAPFDAHELAQSRDSYARQAGAIGLGKEGSPKALKALHGLLADDDRTVRLEALHALEVVRSKESIPYLIDILAGETGRIRGDARTALKGLTGKDLGLSATQWARFWEREQETFQVPTKSEIRKAERLAARKKKGGSRANFYGLDIVSDRVTFIVDTSGSMQQDAYGGGTRMDVARKQLHKAIDGLQDNARFNVISFDSVARHFGKRSVAASKGSKGKAHGYVDDLRPDGGTNVYAALRAAFEDDKIDTIYLVSDGEPTLGKVTDIQALQAEVKRWNSVRNIVIHCIAIGQPHQLLRDLAEEHHGKYVVVN